jgi:L-malate glycosyltransferase
MNPKILHVSAVQLSSGGVERFLLGLCQNLRNDYEIALLSGADKQFSIQMQELDCTIFSWKVNRALDFSAGRKLREIEKLFSPDIIHFHDARARFISRLGNWRGAEKLVYTVHLPPYFYRWRRFTNLHRFFYAGIEKILNTHFTDRVIYPSRWGWEYALRHRYVQTQRGLCIPNGIDLQPFGSAVSNQKEQASTIPIICTVTRLSPEKNIGFLLDAAAILNIRNCLFRLWVVGEGPELAALERKADQLNLASVTRFWGRQEAVVPILMQSDIFALTSWYEGRSLAVMEAQAAGLPCVLSEVGDNALMVEGGCGLLFPEGDLNACVDSLEYLLKNQEERVQVGLNARKKALKEYSLQIMSEQYQKIYRQLLYGLAR